MATWIVDPAHTSVSFSARHMGLSMVRGSFQKFSGEVELDPEDIASARGHAEVDVASIDTGNEQRDAHLRGADFFDADNHPTMSFDAKSVKERGGGEFDVTGDLTIRGVTKPVTLRYEHAGVGKDPYGNEKIGGSLTGKIKRSDFGLTWNVALEAGGFLVGDEIKIEVDGQMVREEEQEVVGQEVAAEVQSQSVR